MLYLGLDTSNYACSGAVYDSQKKAVVSMHRIDLTVKAGELGLRQSDAVFQHTKNLPEIIKRLSEEIDLSECKAIAASASPTSQKGSYMPCFLCGTGLAQSLSQTLSIPFHPSSHQIGHILSALYSCNAEELYRSEFYAVHLSGGTTDVVKCELLYSNPTVTHIASSTDLHAGQCVDRIGRLLGFSFPAGKELSALAQQCTKPLKPKVSMLESGCSLSGLQNRCESLLKKGSSEAEVARFCLESIAETVSRLVEASCEDDLPVLMSGGVSSSIVIKSYLSQKKRKYYFAPPQFCCDNAAGLAILCARIQNEA